MEQQQIYLFIYLQLFCSNGCYCSRKKASNNVRSALLRNLALKKAISKRILSQRFYFFNLTLWLNYKKTGRQMYNEKTQNWNIARSFCAKVLLRIISNKLFVLWQVLKPPIRKAIFKRILRQRF